ncbi:AtpZ/AtpI family protein [Xanthobacter sp. TB0139]|uniref:AtpZ/AtpI family protein n=1 Tax=Xanthobacter sp. TB0139 TaxID=3459178 RepID=UPI00403A1AD4
MSEPEQPPKGEREANAHGNKVGPSEAELFDRLDQLDSSLSQIQSKRQKENSVRSGRDTSAKSGAALAFRLGAEFVSGTLVGALIGYGVDTLLSVSPWGLIFFTLVGFAAGVLNMMRAAGEGGSQRKAGK